MSEERAAKEFRELMKSLRPAFRLWLETDDGYVLGKGTFTLFSKIQEYGSLREAAESLNMSYRYAWGLIQKVEKNLGQPLVETRKGGRSGGGGTELTELACRLMEGYRRLEDSISELIVQRWREFSSQLEG